MLFYIYIHIGVRKLWLTLIFLQMTEIQPRLFLITLKLLSNMQHSEVTEQGGDGRGGKALE